MDFSTEHSEAVALLGMDVTLMVAVSTIHVA